MGIQISFKPTNDLEQFRDRYVEIEDLLIYCTETDCSDLYIEVGERPYLSRYNKITQIPSAPIDADAWETFRKNYISNERDTEYIETRMLDIAVVVPLPETSSNYGKYASYRYRASLGYSEGQFTATFRMIKPVMPTFDTINYPEQCKLALQEAMSKPVGIIYLSGATGSGKSTTLVACLNSFTEPGGSLDNKVIISLEDPIEYELKSKPRVKITQKEKGKDFLNYELGIKQSLREHPNLINVAECRSREEIVAAVEASRTGHMVVTSFHAGDVPGTISRLLFHLNNDPDIAYDLVINLNIIMAQRLMPSDNGYVVNTQYILFNDEVTKRILDAIDKGRNIQVEAHKLLEDPLLQQKGVVKDWD
jgi:Tfp pilus assembly pilus retraction ATPase PilT